MIGNIQSNEIYTPYWNKDCVKDSTSGVDQVNILYD